MYELDRINWCEGFPIGIQPKGGWGQCLRMKNICRAWVIVGHERDWESGSHDLRIEAIWMRVINT